MASADREVAALEGEISQLEGTAATLRTHKDHFDTLIADHEKDGSGGGFFAALTDALEGLVGVFDNGIFGDNDDADAAVIGSSLSARAASRLASGCGGDERGEPADAARSRALPSSVPPSCAGDSLRRAGPAVAGQSLINISLTTFETATAQYLSTSVLPCNK